MYPEYAEIKGKQYKIDTDYKTALKCFEVINDDTIHDYERGYAVVYLLFDIIPSEEDLPLFLKKAEIYLQCGKKTETQSENKKDMDFKQDMSLISSSFRLDYNIKLNEEKIHFWEFIDLIEGLSEKTILNRVRYYRNYDLSKEKDEKIINDIKELKKRYALKETIKKKEFSKEEIANMNAFNNLLGKE